MNKKQHSPEPWIIGYDDTSGDGREYAYGYDGKDDDCKDNGRWDGHGACITSKNEAVVRGGDSFGCAYGVLKEEDANRLVACVNACEGIDIINLERYQMQAIIRHCYQAMVYLEEIHGENATQKAVNAELGVSEWEALMPEPWHRLSTILDLLGTCYHNENIKA